MANYFPREEYHERWRRVHEAMRQRGHDTVVVWSRSGGSYDRCADVLYLVNFYSQASGQGLDTAVFNARGLNAVILQEGQTPELQADEAWPRKDLVATDRIEWHHDPVRGVAESLRRRKVRRVTLVGSGILPLKYWLQLREATPGIEWSFDDDLVLAVRRRKSKRELQCMREAGEIMSGALTRLIEGLVSGERETTTAAAAVSRIVEAGGAIHMAPCNHGDMIQYWVRNQLMGYSHDAPKRGEIVRGWMYGPIHEGYWLDPGRTAVCGGKPTREQRELIETNARVIDTIIAAIRPGVSVMEVAKLGARLMQETGAEKDQAAEKWPHFGHSIGIFIETPYIGETMCSESDRFTADSVLGVEAFLARSGVGSSGFEQNFIVHEDRNEILGTTPMIWW
jgi:Xaa-Pro dipeptidase